MTETKEIVFGVYFHNKKGFAIVEKHPDERKWDWTIDKNNYTKHPIFRCRVYYSAVGTGTYFFNKELKDYVYIGEF